MPKGNSDLRDQRDDTMTDIAAAKSSSDREIVFSRVFDAPRELVWQAMTDPRHVVHWWGPLGFTTTIEEMDVRPGGVWNHVMHGPDGVDYPNRSVFKEIVEAQRIVYSHGGAKKGGPEAEFEATWTFEAMNGGSKTKLTVRMVFPSAAARDLVVKEYGAIEGGKQTLQRLAEHLPRMDPAAGDFVINRILDAPRARFPGMDRAQAHGTVVGSAPVHQPCLRNGCPARRRLSHRHARP